MIEPSAYCIAALLALSALGGYATRFELGRWAIYAATGLICPLLLVIGLVSLGADPTLLRLPLGLPWIGVNLRLDALAAAFLVLIGLGGTGASVYAIGYGRHELEPQRIVPFVP